MNDFEENKKGNIARIIIPIAIVLVTVLLVFVIVKSKDKKKAQNPGGFGGWGGAAVTTVRTIVAEDITLRDFVTTNGNVETQTSVEIYPSIGGKIVQMNVSLGSSVRKGDIIAYVDPSEPGNYYANSPVTAPISGSILSSPVKTGQKVSTASVITKIGDIDNLQITASIPERYVAELKIGLKAEIVLEAYPDTVFYATVSRISPVVDAATRTKEIILHFEKKDPRINAGMFAKVKLFTTEYAGHVAIQQDSLINNNDEYFLYVVNEDGETVSKRPVTLGRNVDGFYQILSGVNPGERVVIEGMLTLADGSKIKDISQPQAEVPAAEN